MKVGDRVCFLWHTGEGDDQEIQAGVVLSLNRDECKVRLDLPHKPPVMLVRAFVWPDNEASRKIWQDSLDLAAHIKKLRDDHLTKQMNYSNQLYNQGWTK